MKQLTIVLLSLLCLFTVACGGPSAKEEAERLHKDHTLATRVIWNDNFVPKLKKFITNYRKIKRMQKQLN